ncbi:hypothetical protein SS50377_20741 [Spironucleus salmonicida]|uniref:Uncharacterized protein n=1 Tax=Spironucleus salmonicida TaxID=348837 RepID=A0A9P8M034_9EUKA|nr:hypothetical protein SS50377_20741 [Spironucleus salmonicida]
MVGLSCGTQHPAYMSPQGGQSSTKGFQHCYQLILYAAVEEANVAFLAARLSKGVQIGIRIHMCEELHGYPEQGTTAGQLPHQNHILLRCAFGNYIYISILNVECPREESITFQTHSRWSAKCTGPRCAGIQYLQQIAYAIRLVIPGPRNLLRQNSRDTMRGETTRRLRYFASRVHVWIHGRCSEGNIALPPKQARLGSLGVDSEGLRSNTLAAPLKQCHVAGRRPRLQPHTVWCLRCPSWFRSSTRELPVRMSSRRPWRTGARFAAEHVAAEWQEYQAVRLF